LRELKDKMRIINDEKQYWTEGKYTSKDVSEIYRLGFWSKSKPLDCEKRDFIFIKAYFLFLLMKLEGLKVTTKPSY
tara:strand:+ start:139 stop:366 length:228 start_codon:yes stop_codon:yes gene_type:complete